jgi:intein/homing endonuclease
MTAQELLDELDESCGPCTKICISCPEGKFLKEIRDVIIELMNENKELKWMYDSLRN